jgi:hypothetical protein
MRLSILKTFFLSDESCQLLLLLLLLFHSGSSAERCGRPSGSSLPKTDPRQYKAYRVVRAYGLPFLNGFRLKAVNHASWLDGPMRLSSGLNNLIIYYHI